jgi:hypothetical protein
VKLTFQKFCEFLWRANISLRDCLLRVTPVLTSVILVSPLTVRADDCSEDGTSAEDAKLALSEVFFLWFTFDGRCRVMACDMGGVEIDEVTGRGASFTSSTSMHSWRSG